MASLPFDKQDTTLVTAIVFLGIFAGLIIYIIAGADLTGIQISGSIDANYLFGIFTGIVIAVIGFLGITRGKAQTPGTNP